MPKAIAMEAKINTPPFKSDRQIGCTINMYNQVGKGVEDIP